MPFTGLGDERPRALDADADRHPGPRRLKFDMWGQPARAVAPPVARESGSCYNSLRRNPTMTTVEKTPAIDPEVLADLEAVCNTKGIVRDPKLLRRITERADQVRQETLKQFGVQEIGAEIIRTMHEPE